MATFEIINGDWLKDHIWQYKIEELISYYMKACGYDSNHTQFTIGSPLYLFGLTILTILLLPMINFFRLQDETRA
jgi:hypothetical protein